MAAITVRIAPRAATREEVAAVPAAFTLAGSVDGLQTELALQMAGVPTQQGGLGIPVAVPMSLDRVAVSWMADDDPGGPWTLILSRRRSGESSYTDVASIEVATS